MTSWKPSNCAETMWISPWWIFMALARQGRREATSRRETLARREATSCNRKARTSCRNRAHRRICCRKLAQAQLTINKCDMLIAKQALRIDELERVLRKFIQ